MKHRLNSNLFAMVLLLSLCGCSDVSSPNELAGFKIVPLSFCTDTESYIEFLPCKGNGELLVSGNQLALLQADTSILFVDTMNASKRLEFSREQKSEAGGLGEILGLYSLTGDSLVLLFSRGFALFMPGRRSDPGLLLLSPGGFELNSIFVFG